VQRADKFLLRDRQEVEKVEESGANAKVITSANYPSGTLRQRYHLSQLDGGWKIVRLDYTCFLCRGTGKLGEYPCKQCRGEGWLDTADRKKHQSE
jgi:DnaJ-class molecular chaperone